MAGFAQRDGAGRVPVGPPVEDGPVPSADPVAAEVDRYRCTDRRDGRRCQLVIGHQTGHAASTGPQIRVRWDDDSAWAEVEDYAALTNPDVRKTWCSVCEDGCA